MPYDNTNSGALFRNDKGDNDKRPDYKGPLNVDGKDMEVAAWLTESKSGQKFLKLKVSEKREQQGQQTQQRQDPQAPLDDLDDEVPF